METLRFRVARRHDAEQIVSLVNSAYRGDESRKGWTTEADLLDGQRTDSDSILETIEKPENIFLLCSNGNSLVGSVHLECQGENCYLGMFTVAPEQQGIGVGKAFLQAAQDFAKTQWKCKTMSMTVIAQREELIAWYKRRGFMETGGSVPFPYGEEKFGTPRRNDLFMIELKKALA